jgi:hypothetical protein
MVDTPEMKVHTTKPDPLWVRDSLEKFISKRIKSKSSDDAALAMDAIEGAARRYASFYANHAQLREYSERRRHLEEVAHVSDHLASIIEKMDFLSIDLIRRARDSWNPAVMASELRFLAAASQAIEEKIQKTGRPREVAEEIWIKSIAEIYNNFFNDLGRKLPTEDFLHFLKLCRPLQFRGKTGKVYGSLAVKQVERALERSEEMLDIRSYRLRKNKLFLLG